MPFKDLLISFQHEAVDGNVCYTDLFKQEFDDRGDMDGYLVVPVDHSSLTLLCVGQALRLVEITARYTRLKTPVTSMSRVT